MAYGIWYFFEIILCTLGVFVVCGLIVSLCERIFTRLVGTGSGYAAIIASSIIGTPIHELGHAIMCLFFWHKINDVRLWQSPTRDGTLGYVNHSYNPKNPYQVFGNMFIAIGPIFSGLSMIMLILLLCYPQSLGEYVTRSGAIVEGNGGFLEMFRVSLSLAIGIFTEGSVEVWWRILAILLILSVCLHISLSRVDIKGGLTSLPIYIIIVLLFAFITTLIGPHAVTACEEGLRFFAMFMLSLFMIVIIFSLIMVMIGIVYWSVCTLIKENKAKKQR